MPKKVLDNNVVNPKKLYIIAFGPGSFTERLWEILNYVKSVKK